MQVFGVTCFGVVMKGLRKTELHQIIIYIMYKNIMVSNDNYGA